MTNYVKDGQRYTLRQLRADNPNVSFPREPSDSVLADYDVYILQQDPKPQAEVVEQGPIVERNGEWWQSWTSRNKTSEEKAADIRSERDRLLEETDHYALSDVTMSQDMADYRQALRDIPQQEGFPNNIVWPTKP